jgi:mannose/fructose/N-acetylgalactosamine-specific phosphotransferase system component IIB
MTITLVRVDDRVIHGQIVARWSRFKPCNGILVIDDNIAQNPIQKKIFTNAAPTGVKVGVFTVDESIEKIKKAIDSKKSYFLIVKTPITLQKILEKGGDFGTDINVGPISAKVNGKTIAKNVTISEVEKSAFDFLEINGKNIQFQLIPDGKAAKWSRVKQNF